MVDVFPALSEIENEPCVIPIPPFKEDSFVSFVNLGLRSVARALQPGIAKSILTLLSTPILKVSEFPI